METSTVQYWTDPSAKSVAEGKISKTYTAADMCSEPATDVHAFIDPGYIHDVLLTNLTPGTKYYYSYGSMKVIFLSLNYLQWKADFMIVNLTIFPI